MKIVTAKVYVGSGLEPEGETPRRYTRHRVVIDPRELPVAVEEIVSKRFPGATITKARGRWRGRGEPSLVIELWEGEKQRTAFFRAVAETAAELTASLDQIAVAVVTTDGGRTDVDYLGAGTLKLARTAARPARRRHT